MSAAKIEAEFARIGGLPDAGEEIEDFAERVEAGDAIRIVYGIAQVLYDAPAADMFPRTGEALYAALHRHMIEQANCEYPSWSTELTADEKAAWGRLAAELVEQAAL